MTSGGSTDLKEVIFINQDVARQFEALPAEMRETVEARTTIIQNGGRLPSRHVQSLQGSLAGVSEIRVPFDSDTYRVYFAAAFAKVVYMLDAGMKKSAHGADIPRWQTDRLVSRLRQAEAHYRDNAALLNARSEARRLARASAAADHDH